MALKTVIARSAEEMDELAPLWQRCMAADRFATVFQSFEWNRAVARYFSDREQPYVIAVETGEEATIIPAALAGGAVTLLGERLGDYRGILSTNPEGQTMVWAWAALTDTNLVLRFTALRPEHHPVFDQVSTQSFAAAPYLDATGTSAEEFAKHHNRMFSRLRKLERLGFTICKRTATDAELLRWISGKKAEADPKSLFHDRTRVAVLVEAFGALASGVQVATLERQGVLIAAAVAIEDRDVLRFYTNWYDAEWAHYSPGMVLLYEITRRALEAGRSCDYMTGEQPYKLRMASGVAPLRRVDASAEEVRGAAEWLARRPPFALHSV